MWRFLKLKECIDSFTRKLQGLLVVDTEANHVSSGLSLQSVPSDRCYILSFGFLIKSSSLLPTWKFTTPSVKFTLWNLTLGFWRVGLLSGLLHKIRTMLYISFIDLQFSLYLPVGLLWSALTKITLFLLYSPAYTQELASRKDPACQWVNGKSLTSLSFNLLVFKMKWLPCNLKDWC